MDVNFSYVAASPVEPVIYEQVLGEKPGGGRVTSPDFDIPTGTAVGKDSNGALQPIKAYRLLKAVTTEDTTIEIAKGSGIKTGDVIGNAKKSVACTDLDQSDAT